MGAKRTRNDKTALLCKALQVSDLKEMYALDDWPCGLHPPPCPECGKTFSRWYLDRSMIQQELTQLQPCSQPCKPVSGSVAALQANYHAHTAAHRIIQQILAGSLTFIGLQDPEELQPLSDYTTPSLQQHGDRRKNIGSNRKIGG